MAIAENDKCVVSSRRLARVSKRNTPITEEAQPKPTAELRRESRLFRIRQSAGLQRNTAFDFLSVVIGGVKFSVANDQNGTSSGSSVTGVGWNGV